MIKMNHLITKFCIMNHVNLMLKSTYNKYRIKMLLVQENKLYLVRFNNKKEIKIRKVIQEVIVK